ncbi:MAG: alginate lyase family protein, partial [Clostridia bacterium]|nr:alginate lyase family protein [Clostridia bacterium]
MGIHGAYELISEMGISWFIWRSLYELELRTGILRRRFPPTDPGKALAQSVGVPLDKLDSFLFERWANNEARFFLDPEIARYQAVVTQPDIVLKVANAAKQGRFLFFNHWWAELGDPPDWFINPVTGIRFPNTAHWSQIPDLSPELGDIKYVWEPSRHAQVYYYARAYALTGDQEYPEAFWRQFEHWVASNPAELGPNWRCGQEIALRSLAWIFGLFAFRSDPATTVRRIALMLQYLWYQALHIEKIHWYAARCVRNNHAISEAAGLFTIGTLFPFLPGAKRWQAKGLRFLTKEAMWQIYEDGTYVQHSMNYARLVVQLFTWCLRVGQINGVELPDPLRKRLQQLVSFLVSVQDARTGRVPNYGSNDGALVFPLSSCDYLDYRPALNALNLALTGKKLYEAGPWDEEAAWFCGPNLAEPGPTSRGAGDQSGVTSTLPKVAIEQTGTGDRPQQVGRGQAFPVGGYYVLHGPA